MSTHPDGMHAGQQNRVERQLEQESRAVSRNRGAHDDQDEESDEQGRISWDVSNPMKHGRVAQCYITLGEPLAAQAVEAPVLAVLPVGGGGFAAEHATRLGKLYQRRPLSAFIELGLEVHRRQ